MGILKARSFLLASIMAIAFLLSSCAGGESAPGINIEVIRDPETQYNPLAGVLEDIAGKICKNKGHLHLLSTEGTAVKQHEFALNCSGVEKVIMHVLDEKIPLSENPTLF